MDYNSKADTLEHIQNVRKAVDCIVIELINRAENHDASKLGQEEKAIFDEFTPKLKGLTYGSDEYKACTAKMGEALKHHYAVNRHHPEYFTNGIKGMNLIDLMEMFCDWYAATKRHADGDIVKSIDIQQKKLGFSDDLKQLFLNSVEVLK